MPFDINAARPYLQSFNLKKLFIEQMGWDRPGPDIDIPFNDDVLHLTGIAQKRGMMVYVCSPLADGKIPYYSERRKIETQLRKSVHEHLIIFINLDHSHQVWQWVRREAGRPTTSREFEYTAGHSGQALLERLQGLVFTLEEEENLGITDVTSRVRATFDVERVTRRFYDRFKDEHGVFMRFLQGIPDEGLKRWYVSVTLNRLMFVYFIQKKQFLNGDEHYLRNHLAQSPHGEDRFYREFLCPLFFEGFARRPEERSSQMNRLLGHVPYLNGGIFQPHQIELAYGRRIQIPDAAFERIFAFFDQYHWHLDERPLRDDREINPDVLGYIFEKYINQKEMGAYYTKEDITGYIGKSTILPYLLDQARKECAIAFSGPQSIWRLLAADPRRYIYPAVQKGVDLELPEDVQAGVADIAQRSGWNRQASEEYALPTEIWREVVARRERFGDVYRKLSNGEICEINDLITYNLDIQQFVQDVIESSEGPELLRAFWKPLRAIKILDPTCGSGAFLFAALNILEPPYEACLERMRAFVDELDASGEKHRPEKFNDFRETLVQMAEHPNRRYFILKSIILNNLYGVDIMDEAVEICKLRLFLKLIAQVEEEQIEPLPDIDFNIRAGNTLIGFTSIQDVRRSMMNTGKQMRMLYPEEEAYIKKLEEDADLADRAYKHFQHQQLEIGSVTEKDKVELRRRLDHLNTELHRALAKMYSIDPDSLAFSPWLESHKPFHWLVDFYGIVVNGGFDVIIGNPPYVEYSKVRDQYQVTGYQTFNCNNLYVYVTERSISMLRNNGFSGFIVPVSAFSNQSMHDFQKYIKNFDLHIASFHQRPAQLFDGVLQRLSIFILRNRSSKNSTICTTTVRRWYADERTTLFSTLAYIQNSNNDQMQIAKMGSQVETGLLKKLSEHKVIRSFISPLSKQDKNFISYRTAGGGYWLTFLNSRFETESLSNKVTAFQPSFDARIFMAILNSTLFWWYYYINYDLFNLKDYMIFSFKFNYPTNQDDSDQLISLAEKLERDLLSNSVRYLIRSRTRGDKYTLKYQNYKSKPILDEIDKVLARLYQFSSEELDFIINFDIKYRLSNIEE